MSFPARHGWFQLLLVSEACAFAFAITYVVVMRLSLPPTDGAYGSAPFSDPLVLEVMSVLASVAGAAVFPFMYLTLRRRRLRVCLPILLGVTFGWIVLVTPVNAGLGFPGSFAALGAGLLICRSTCPLVYPRGLCQGCGYDLTGNVSGRCPECGATISSRSDKPAKGDAA